MNILHSTWAVEYRMMTGNWPPGDTQDLFGSHAAGLDCVGFVQRCASYINTPYTWTQTGTNRHLGEYFWGDTRGSTTYPTSVNGYSWKITNSSNIDLNDIDNDGDISEILNISYIVPGDIIYFEANHIAVVNNIEYNSNYRITSIDNFYLIESTLRVNNWGNVYNAANIQLYINFGFIN